MVFCECLIGIYMRDISLCTDSSQGFQGIPACAGNPFFNAEDIVVQPYPDLRFYGIIIFKDTQDVVFVCAGDFNAAYHFRIDFTTLVFREERNCRFQFVNSINRLMICNDNDSVLMLDQFVCNQQECEILFFALKFSKVLWPYIFHRHIRRKDGFLHA